MMDTEITQAVEETSLRNHDSDVRGFKINGSLIRIKLSSRKVRVNDSWVRLTQNELLVLWALAQQPGKPLSRKEILAARKTPHKTTQERSADMIIHRIRQKLNFQAIGALIESVRNEGYEIPLEYKT